MLGFLTRATRGVDGSAELGGSQKMYFFKNILFRNVLMYHLRDRNFFSNTE